MQEQEQLDISPLQEFPPSPPVTDVPLFPNSTPMADSSGNEISFSDNEDMAVDAPVNTQSLENSALYSYKPSEEFEPSLNNSNDAHTQIPEESFNQSITSLPPQEADSALYSYKPSEAFQPSFNNSNDAINQLPEASNNQSSLSLPLENSDMDINQLPEANMDKKKPFTPSFSNSDCSPQPLSELSSPLNFQGFSSVPLCRLGK